jgi:hypothetical protein
MSQKLSEEDIVYALKVLDAVGEGFDHVAAQPELLNQFSKELMKNFPNVLDALLAIVRPDCRPVVLDLGKKMVNMVKQCHRKHK